MFSGDKKASYKTILMALAGLAKELYIITALSATFFSLVGFYSSFVTTGRRECLIHVPQCSSHQGVQIHIPSSLLGFGSSQLGREKVTNVLSLPCFARWEPGCATTVSPGLGHARTWGWQKGPGLSEAPGGKTQLLCGLLSTPLHLRLLTAVVQVSSPFCAHLAHLSGRGRGRSIMQHLKAGRDWLSSSSQNSWLFSPLPLTSRFTELPATLEGDVSAGWYLLKALL